MAATAVPTSRSGVTELGGRQAGAVDLQHRQIALCILSHQQGLEHTLILEHHIHGAASLNDVAVGDDIPSSDITTPVPRLMPSPLLPRMLTMEAMFSR